MLICVCLRMYMYACDMYAVCMICLVGYIGRYVYVYCIGNVYVIVCILHV